MRVYPPDTPGVLPRGCFPGDAYVTILSLRITWVPGLTRGAARV